MLVSTIVSPAYCEIVAKSYVDSGIETRESLSNKIKSTASGGLGLTDQATDNQYPSAKAVHDGLAEKAADGDVVKLTGDQTVAGMKTFSAAPVIPEKSGALRADAATAVAATEKQVYDSIDNVPKFIESASLSAAQTSSAIDTKNFYYVLE
ncbi:MAG: hypothetical protein LBK26_04105 [Rickettsiales bacterium]|nr:hypothetical protein [Rickettsiales bacterium]